MIKRSLLVWGMACLARIGAAGAATYYVDSVKGNDADTGTVPERAWQSLNKANAVMLEPGDRLLLKAGSAWSGSLRPKGSGTADQRIVLDRYGDGPRPVIHGGGVSGGVIRLENQQFWSVRNLEVTNQGSAERRKMGIQVVNSAVGTLTGIEVSGCFIHDVAGDMTDYKDGKESGGITLTVTAAHLDTPSRWDDIRILNNTIENVARNAILMQSQWINKPKDPNSTWKGHGDYLPSTNVRVAGNRIERVGGDGIVLWCVKGGVIERNFVRQCNNNSFKQGHAAVWPYFCEDTVFQYNEVSETKTKYDGMAFDFDNSNQRCVYQYNYSHDNEGGFVNMCSDGNSNGNIVRYNVSQNDGCLAGSRVFLVHGDGNHGYRVYNNTVYVRDGDPQVFEQGAPSGNSSILFQNNIFVNAGKGSFKAPGGCRFEANLYFGNGQIVDDAKKIVGDPRLVAPGAGRLGFDSTRCYKLMPGSPASGAGVVVTDNGGRDFWGQIVSDAAPPNLGAYNGPPLSRPEK